MRTDPAWALSRSNAVSSKGESLLSFLRFARAGEPQEAMNSGNLAPSRRPTVTRANSENRSSLGLVSSQCCVEQRGVAVELLRFARAGGPQEATNSGNLAPSRRPTVTKANSEAGAAVLRPRILPPSLTTVSFHWSWPSLFERGLV